MQVECVPAGFSAEAWAVVQRKPTARILDCTAGNRHIWGKEKMRDDVIFTDKEPRLKIPPDLLCEWRDLPQHFPPDYFHCTIFDPPFYARPASKWFKVQHCDPLESNKDKELGTHWWGETYPYHGAMIRDFVKVQQEFARVSPRLCFKWCDADLPVDRILTVFTDWQVQFKQSIIPTSRGKKYGSRTWWVKLVRRTVDDKDGTEMK